jgi:ABC-type multidrug transport system fused ATPase/permease subunit
VNEDGALFEAPIMRRRSSSHVLERRVTRVMVDESEQFELQRIATALSRRYSTATPGPSAGQDPGTLGVLSPAMDPSSAKFDLEKWLQAFVRTLQDHGVTANNTGIVYKNLDVFGTNASSQTQQTVGTYLKAPLHLGKFFSFGKKQQKQILHRFDGLIKPGELVIVLGKPGSGCSTFLKTLTGQLHGLTVGDESVIHYDGIPLKMIMQEFKGEAVYNQEVRSFAISATQLPSDTDDCHRWISISRI